VETAPAVLSMRHITKRFYGTTVLDDVSLDCHRGEVHAIVGENGAGKSTLMKILGGEHRPDSGTVLLDGAPARLNHPRQALARGISIIHQEHTLLPDRSVAENVLLGRETRRGLAVDRRAMAATTAALLAELDLGAISPHAPVRRLSVAQQQGVEIAKALSYRPRILVMDEPTAALTPDEAAALFARVRVLVERGLTVLYISHRLGEIFEFAQRVTVLKDGRRVATLDVAATTPADLVQLMVGRDPLAGPTRAAAAAGDAPVRLAVRDGSVPGLHAVNLDLRAGQIVGVAGLDGSGRTELARALTGVIPLRTGTIEIDGRPVRLRSPRAAIRAGIGFLTADRKTEGLVLPQSSTDNALLAVRAFRRSRRRDGAGGGAYGARVASRRTLPALAARVKLPAAALRREVRLLSGGNQQKVVVTKWLARGAGIYVFDEPTRGIDIGAKATIHHLMRELADEGAAILMVSSELTEVIAVSDRILVMHHGRVAGELPAGSDARGGGVTSFAAAARLVRIPPVRASGSSAPIWAVFGLVFGASWLLVGATGGAFVTTQNFQNIAQRSVALGLVATGQALVVLAGSLDLSVAYTVSLASVATSVVMAGDPGRIWLGVAAALGVGAAVGLANGVVIAGLKVNAFIATFGVGLVVRGVLNGMFDNFAGKVPEAFQALGYDAVAGVPVSLLLLAAVVAGAWYLMHRTAFGYHVYAVGGNPEVARLSGIRAVPTLLVVHLLAGVCAALGGLFLASRLGAGAPWVGPQGGYDLESIAAVVLGGVALAGGRGRLLGTTAAVLMFAVLDSVFNHFEADPFLRTLLRGVIIIGAVALYARRADRGAP
jgi:ABC-type sugar transport system ATPase subunit/ribose/xylose/arabinose/galactoside ABC-type transport system permease subunit